MDQCFSDEFSPPRIHSTDEYSSEGSDETDEDSLDALMRDYDGYGTTPPRTRIHHKLLKKRSSIGKVFKGLRKHSPALDHHSNIDSEEDGIESKKKSDKRSIHLLRSSERNFKLNIEDMSEVKEDRYTKVESARRFLSLNCQLVKTVRNWKSSIKNASINRSEFNDYLESLVKAGNSETKSYKSQKSNEHLWQTELKDLIWLELQAYLADRTVTEQDKYLCEARQAVPHLLNEILTYKYEKKLSKLSVQSNDSGVDLQDNGEICAGCLCLFCPTCMEYEVLALQEVGNLLNRLESAEALFPSNKSFGNLFPCYKSPEFRGRVKAMCLWYNITRQFRLKTLIVGKQLMSYAEGSDLSSSNNSDSKVPINFSCWEWNYADTSHFIPLHQLGHILEKSEGGGKNIYRQLIQDHLKNKGLKKSFLFMEQSKILRRGRIALEKPDNTPKESGENGDNNYLDEKNIRKYGYWSEEYQSLNLPSFRSAFLFITKVPFHIIHECLIMKLESKLEKPSSLSIRQLMKELRATLKLGVVTRERYIHHCEIALVECDESLKIKYLECVKVFDNTAKEIIELYLSYLEQWVSITQFGKLQKNILEEEWKFIMNTAPYFPGCEAKSIEVFCNISCEVLKILCSHLKEGIEALTNEYSEKTEEENLAPSATIFCSSNLPHRKMLHLCRGLQSLFVETRERTIHIVTLMKILVKHCHGDKEENRNGEKFHCPIEILRGEALKLCEVIKEEISLIESVIPKNLYDDNEGIALPTRVREVIHQMYRYAFEYYKEIGKIVPCTRKFIQDMFKLAVGWLNFVKSFCEKGRGVRPSWANFGIEFILYISNPVFTKQLFDEEFLEFRNSIEAGVDYIKGSPTLPSSTPTGSTQGFYRPSISFIDPNHISQGDKVDSSDHPRNYKLNRKERICAAVKLLDEKMESKLQEQDLIGTIISSSNNNIYDKKFIKSKTVTFSWQRGIKIGQGRFGKVYTAVNTDTGELMAMKEIPLSPNDARTIKSVATELKIFEGINHENLVKYYGAEIHKDELLIFMELCTEGTLEGFIMGSENGLPESIVRRYTKQLTQALDTLHEHSIVHRDIKPANIFLTSDGNKLKLGDFGSAVKIRAHTTAPGELKGFVGTQAYMAPEVFMKTNSVGHGRAADIWSLGCVVIEMASGKRPWAEYDSNYQIMFKVGMGESPLTPDTLSEEGQSFVSLCIQHNPKRRATIKSLIQHNFLKVESEEEGIFWTMPSELVEYLKLGIKR